MLSFDTPSIGNDVYALHGRQIISRFLHNSRGYPAAPGIGIKEQLKRGIAPVNAAIDRTVADVHAADAKECPVVEPVAILGAGILLALDC